MPSGGFGPPGVYGIRTEIFLESAGGGWLLNHVFTQRAGRFLGGGLSHTLKLFQRRVFKERIFKERIYKRVSGTKPPLGFAWCKQIRGSSKDVCGARLHRYSESSFVEVRWWMMDAFRIVDTLPGDHCMGRGTDDKSVDSYQNPSAECI